MHCTTQSKHYLQLIIVDENNNYHKLQYIYPFYFNISNELIYRTSTEVTTRNKMQYKHITLAEIMVDPEYYIK